MDIIIDWRHYETEFADEKITMELRPLKSWAMFALTPYLDNPNPRKPDESPIEYRKRLTDEEMSTLTKNSEKIQELSAKIFPEHVRNLKEIKVNGEDVTFDQIASESIFLNLAVEISGQLASISEITKVDEKNFERESEPLKLEKVINNT